MNDLFIVIEWNQAGGLPQIADHADIHTRLEDAIEAARERVMYAAPRRDRYVVARLQLLDEDDEQWPGQAAEQMALEQPGWFQ